MTANWSWYKGLAGTLRQTAHRENRDGNQNATKSHKSNSETRTLSSGVGRLFSFCDKTTLAMRIREVDCGFGLADAARRVSLQPGISIWLQPKLGIKTQRQWFRRSFSVESLGFSAYLLRIVVLSSFLVPALLTPPTTRLPVTKRSTLALGILILWLCALAGVYGIWYGSVCMYMSHLLDANE